MLYISPGVSASSKLNSNKNNHAHISSLIGLLCFQGSSSLSSRVSKHSWLSPFYRRGRTGIGFRWLAGCHGCDKWQKGNWSQASEYVLPTMPHWPSSALLPCSHHQRANQQLAAMSPTKASLWWHKVHPYPGNPAVNFLKQSLKACRRDSWGDNWGRIFNSTFLPFDS